MAETGEGVEQDTVEAVRMYQRAADLGDPNAQCNLGVMYRDGIVPSDGEIVDGSGGGVAPGSRDADMEAVRLCRSAAEQGLPEAQMGLGLMYETGRGLEKSDTEAARLYQTAAAGDDVDAMKALAAMLLVGRGVQRNEVEAARLYQRAAAAGDVLAMSAAGRLLQEGKASSPEDDMEAVRLLTTAAASDVAEAQCYLGKMYLEGRGGLKQDDAKATTLIKGAAERSDPAACFLLATIYEKGTNQKILPRDDGEAIRWYLRSAELGHAPAQYAAARRFESGKGVQKDLSKASEFYSMATAGGYEKAMRAKQKLNGKLSLGSSVESVHALIIC